jgi:N-acetyl-alpha-D-muramate 1-phosphate uridylyltransferase
VQCVILAGGRGTRMQPVTDTIPKSLVPVAGRPFVEHQLEWLNDQGVTDIVFCIGYRGDQLREVVGDRARYVDEGDELRGTAGALRLALDEGVLAESFTVLYGDSYLPIALPPIWEAFRKSGAPALMVVMRNENRWDASNARFENGFVVDYDKRNAARRPELEWIDYGLAVHSRDLVAERLRPGVRADLAHLYGELSREGELAGFEVGERFYEAGSPEGVADLERYFAARARKAAGRRRPHGRRPRDHRLGSDRA